MFYDVFFFNLFPLLVLFFTCFVFMDALKTLKTNLHHLLDLLETLDTVIRAPDPSYNDIVSSLKDSGWPVCETTSIRGIFSKHLENKGPTNRGLTWCSAPAHFVVGFEKPQVCVPSGSTRTDVVKWFGIVCETVETTKVLIEQRKQETFSLFDHIFSIGRVVSRVPQRNRR